MGCSIVSWIHSISGGVAIAEKKKHGLPQECLLDRFVKIIEVVEVTVDTNAS